MVMEEEEEGAAVAIDEVAGSKGKQLRVLNYHSNQQKHPW